MLPGKIKTDLNEILDLANRDRYVWINVNYKFLNQIFL